MVNMKIVSLAGWMGFFFLGVTYASHPGVSMDSIRQIHVKMGNRPSFYHLTGKFTDNEIKGSSFWGYVEVLKEEVKEKRETCVTLKDIEEWAQFNRNSYTTDFDVKVWGTSDFYRQHYTYPPKTKSPWSTDTETIVNEENCFYIDHTKRNIGLNDNSDFAETQKRNQDFPALTSFLYPFNFIRENENDYTVTLKDRGNGVVDFVAILKDENPPATKGGLYMEIGLYTMKEIRAELLVDKEYCAQKCLVKRCNTARMDRITAMQFSAIHHTADGYFPEKVTITKWWQYTRPDEKPESEAMKHLLPSSLTWELPNDFADRTLSYKWIGDFQEVHFTLDLNDEMFWPAVPEGYSYADRRSRYDESNEGITFKPVVGTGPHTFIR